ncbi:MAG: TonB-dependent receptor [Bacteroidota bacterium]
MRLVFILIVSELLLFSPIVLSQNIAISGCIIDSLTQDPLPYSSIRFIDNSTQILKIGGISDSIGCFSIEINEPGIYDCRFNYLGYQSRNIRLNIGKKDKSKNLGIIRLNQTTNSLQEVEVISHSKNMISVDRQIYFVDSMDITESPTAIDLMTRVPEIKINPVNNSISITGKESTMVMINGIYRKDQLITLQSINPADIEKIEIITSPGSEYDSEIEGVINIILKSEPKTGISTYTELLYRTICKSFEPVEMVQFGASKIRMSINLFPSIKKIPISSEFVRKAFVTDNAETILSSVFDSHKRTDMSNVINGSLDYYISKKDIVNYSTEQVFSIENQENTLEYQFLKTDTIIKQQSDNKHETNYFLSNNTLFYKHIFDTDRHEVNANYNFHYMIAGYSDRYIDSCQINDDNFNINRRNIVEKGKKISNHIKLDYKLPVSDKSVFYFGLSGYKQSFYSLIEDQESEGKYDNLRSSTYSDISFSLNKLQLKAGMKYELYRTKCKDVSYAANLILPYAILNYRHNSIFSLRASYRSTAFYPSAWQLVPYEVKYDLYNTVRGNPYLVPETNRKAELACIIRKKSNHFSALFFHSNSVNSFGVIREMISEKECVREIVNIDRRSVFGVDLVSSLNLFETIDIEASCKVYKDEIQHGSLSVSGESFRASVFAGFFIPGDYYLGVDFSAAGKMLTLQGYATTPPGISMAFVQKRFFDRKACIALGCLNPFNTERFDQYITAPGMELQIREMSFTRCLYIKCYYSFRRGRETAPGERESLMEKDVK